MTLKDAIGVKIDIDIKTGTKLTHSEICRREIDLLGGLDEVAKYVPYPVEVLRKKYKTDRFFSNTYIGAWNDAAGFVCSGMECRPTYGGLWHLYREHGINAVSCSQGVSILKEAAIMLVERDKEAGCRV